jgi:ABC-type Fe3+/spermidine/putrescine transport system ATPase subunit
MNELRAILKQVGVTSIYVTHDQQEAFAVADRVIIMNRGRIVQQGTPQSVYRRPTSPWVARFLGLGNLVAGRVAAIETGPSQRLSIVVETALGDFAIPQAEGVSTGQPVTVLIRPEAARLAEACPGEEDILVQGTVDECSFRGSHTRLVIRHQAGLDLAFELVSEAARLPGRGEPVCLALRRDAVSLLAEENDE